MVCNIASLPISCLLNTSNLGSFHSIKSWVVYWVLFSNTSWLSGSQYFWLRWSRQYFLACPWRLRISDNSRVPSWKCLLRQHCCHWRPKCEVCWWDCAKSSRICGIESWKIKSVWKVIRAYFRFLDTITQRKKCKDLEEQTSNFEEKS